MSYLSSRSPNQVPGGVLNKRQNHTAIPVFSLLTCLGLLITRSTQTYRGLGGKGLLQVSTPTSHLERERHKASKWVSREVNVKHRILWVTNAGCHWGCPCLFTCRQESFEMCWSSTQSRVQQELGQRSVQILKEMAAQAEENTLPAAKLAHLDKSVYLEIGCLLCGHGKGCCGHPWVQISPTVKLSCAALSKQKAEMSICGFIPVCLYPSVLQRQGWE